MEFRRDHPGVRLIDGVPEHKVDGDFEAHTRRRLDLLHQSVAELLHIARGGTPLVPTRLDSDARLLLDAASSMKLSSPAPASVGGMSQLRSAESPLGGSGGFGAVSGGAGGADDPAFPSPAHSFRTLPFSVVAGAVGVPRPIRSLVFGATAHARTRVDYDVISSGVLTLGDAADLMTDFRANYGRWVLFPLHVASEDLITQIRGRSSLLLTTCCALALRYLLNGKPSPGDVDSHRRRKDTYKLVMRQLVRDLDRSLVRHACFLGSTGALGDIEFLQAMVILSIYALSLLLIVTNTIDADSLVDDDLVLRDLNLDLWHLSGLALATFISKANVGSLFAAGSTDNLSPNFTVLFDDLDSNDDQTLTVLRIYNHLILIHLVSCVFSGRMCMVDEIRLNYCMQALSLPGATNFDGRMVSEIGILLITYNYVQVNLNAASLRDLGQIDANLEAVKDEIHAWYDQWDYLFSQPALQFVEFCYNFCYILIYFNYIYSKLLVASKISMVLDIFHRDTMGDLLKYADKTSLIKIVSHAYTLVMFILTIEDDSYFAYLSDQIHFCFFYGALTLLKTLEFLKTNDKLHYLNDPDATAKGLSEKDWKVALAGVSMLVEKYERVAQDNPDDIITMYKNGVLECLHALFPTAGMDA